MEQTAGHPLPSRPGWHWLLAALVLVLACAAAFHRVLAADFINFDDDVYVTANPLVRGGLSLPGLAGAFTRPLASIYQPLTQLSLMADASIWGEDPFGFHLTNLLLHIANALLLLLLLFRLTGAWWRSLAAGALFALHPLRVESVAWVTERKDVLSGLFFLLALLAWHGWLRRRGAGRQALVLALFAAALLSKQMVVTLPLLLLLLDWWPGGRHPTGPAGPAAALPLTAPRTGCGLLVEKLPLFGLALVFGLLALAMVAGSGSAAGLEQLGLGARLGNAAVAYARYLGKFCWPGGLSVFYPHPGPAGPPGWQVAAAAALLAGLTAAALWQARRRPWLLVGWLWFCIGLAPVSGVAQAGSHALADRFTYLPAIGLGLAVVWQGWELLARRLPARLARPLAAGLMGLWLALLGGLSWQQTGHWRDSVSVFRQALASGNDHHFVRTNLGQALLARGEPQRATHHLRRALELEPSAARAANNLGVIASRRGRLQRARAWFERAIASRPDYADAYDNLAIVLYRQGDYQAAWRRVAESLERGGRPHPGFLRALARRRPPPPELRRLLPGPAP
jgi:tetratricopeptide (TPR) repeat protein